MTADQADQIAARIEAEERALDWQTRAQAAESEAVRLRGEGDQLRAELADLRRVVVELARAGAVARREAEDLRARRDLARDGLEELWRSACGGPTAPLPAVGLQVEDLRAALARRAMAAEVADRIMRLEQELCTARAGEETWRTYARGQREAFGEAYQAAVEGRMVDALRALMAPVDGR